MSIRLKAKNILERLGLHRNSTTEKMYAYLNQYNRYAFSDVMCENYEQYEAVITRWYHTIEKGLSYREYRAGFGKENIDKLLNLMEAYSKQYNTEAFFYKTALSCLHQYIQKNAEYGVVDSELNQRVDRLSGSANEYGGTITVTNNTGFCQSANFEQLLKGRHSIREFSEVPVEIEQIKHAIRLAQYTPSACNRQGWKTRVVASKDALNRVLACQNGNRGFTEYIDKLLLITCDIRYFNKRREFFQPFIDGGMYAENIINALFYEGIGSIPLSASLTHKQEQEVRAVLNIPDSEVFILFVGVGNYPNECLTARSERKKDVEVEVI